MFDDGIQVKGQKAQRQPLGQLRGNKRQGTLKTKTPDVATDVVLLQKAMVGFEYIAAPINQVGSDLLSLSDVIRAKIIQEYGKETNPLNLMAITDGARAIRNRLLAVFGGAVTVILDWYDLGKKLHQLMSMIAVDKAEKLINLKFLIPQIWYVQVTIALFVSENSG